ncbi:MAG TPA: hypothetical protein VE135_09555 [Pyrinomonadaceae bacterium]|nr:hypothetical protein [Pyrinomonadaceae bacterium]
MRKHLMTSALALACLTLILVPMPVQASPDMFISVNPTTLIAGEWAGVSAVIINTSSSKARITVTFEAVDPCGTKMDLGYNRLALAPGQSVLVTTAYPTSANSCRGMHAVSVSTGAKGRSAPISATAYLEVQ